MPATNYTPIQLYRSTTSGNLPLAANLSPGELALNIADNDMTMYMENASGVVKSFFNNPAALKYPTADGTSGQVLQTNGAGVLSFGAAGGGANIQSFTATGTYTKPSGAQFVYVELWSGADGGYGGGPNGAGAPRGGNGGSYAYKMFAAPQVGATETVTIGAGGAGGTGCPFSPPFPPTLAGGAGGNTNFGTLLYAYSGTSSFFNFPTPPSAPSPDAGFFAFSTPAPSNLLSTKIGFYAGGQGGGGCSNPLSPGGVSFFGGGGGGAGGRLAGPAGGPPSCTKGGDGGKGRAFGSSSASSQSRFYLSPPPGSPSYFQQTYGGGGGASTAWPSSTASVAGNDFNGGGGGKGSIKDSCGGFPASTYPSTAGAAGGIAGGGGGGGIKTPPGAPDNISAGKNGGAGGNGYAIVYTW